MTLQEAQHSARLATPAILTSLKASLGDLDRVGAWLIVSGYVNAELGYPQTAPVPLNMPVVISAEVEFAAAQG